MATILGYQATILQILAVIFGIGILVFIHELGHFVSAKKLGAKVEKFTFGLGPEIIGFTRGETRYALCAIPLGGMTKIPGESIDEATGAPGEFFSLQWYKRLIIAACGPIMNYLLAAILFTVVIYFWGIAIPMNEAVIGEIMPGKPADKAGLKVNDRVVAVDKQKITSWVQMAEIIQKNGDKAIDLHVMRDNKELDINVVPEIDPSRKVAVIGIVQGVETKKVGFAASVGYSLKAVVFQSVFTLTYLGEKIIKLEKPELAGPIGVAQILAKAAKAGVEQLLHILAIISVALGLFNLLPIPIVDGGHILFSLVEAVTRRPLNKKVVQYANVGGLALIVFIFIFATYSDIGRLGLKFLSHK